MLPGALVVAAKGAGVMRKGAEVRGELSHRRRHRRRSRRVGGEWSAGGVGPGRGGWRVVGCGWRRGHVTMMRCGWWVMRGGGSVVRGGRVRWGHRVCVPTGGTVVPGVVQVIVRRQTVVFMGAVVTRMARVARGTRVSRGAMVSKVSAVWRRGPMTPTMSPVVGDVGRGLGVVTRRHRAPAAGPPGSSVGVGPAM